MNKIKIRITTKQGNKYTSEIVGFENQELFTGFTDCEGSEIYEGDIIQSETEIIKGKPIYDQCVVFWNQEEGRWDVHGKHTNGSLAKEINSKLTKSVCILSNMGKEE